MQTLQLPDVLIHKLALFDALALTLNRGDAARALPLWLVTIVRNRNGTSAAGRAHSPLTQRSLVLQRTAAQRAVDALSLARGEIRLRRILHLLPPGGVLGANDGAHLVEQIEVALLNFSGPLCTETTDGLTFYLNGTISKTYLRSAAWSSVS